MHRNVTDEELKAIKHDLYEEMMRRKMDKKTRQGIYDFLAYYVSFQNQDNFIIFEKEVETKLGRRDTMGTREYLLDKAERKGRKEERAKAEAEKLVEKQNFAIKMLKSDVDIGIISGILGLSVKEIKKLQ